MREALFSIQVLIQRCRDVNVDVYACFLDYEKAFDTVNHDNLMSILKELGLDGRDIRIIANLYWGQTARVRINGDLSEEVLIKRGVRQGCVLSPLLFNIYAEKIFGDALNNKTAGIVVGGTVINNLRYADDTVLLATNIEDLQELMSSVVEHSTLAGLKLNINKTKWFVVSKTPTVVQENLKVGTEIIERVKSFKYLGSHINENWDMSSEIRSRIEQARRSFTNMRNILTNRFLNIPLRIRLLRCYVYSTLYYGVEAWTLTEAMCKKLEAFEMWTYRRLLKIPWTDYVTNIDVLKRVKKSKEVLNTIKKKKLEYFGHVIRNEKYRLLQVVIQGKIEGKRGPGRRRISWLKNLRQWYGQSTTSLFRKAADKVQIMRLIVNALGGHDT
jgi:Reverse transcriptase (RNA-dependent DNA polymerase)